MSSSRHQTRTTGQTSTLNSLGTRKHRFFRSTHEELLARGGRYAALYAGAEALI